MIQPAAILSINLTIDCWQHGGSSEDAVPSCRTDGHLDEQADGHTDGRSVGRVDGWSVGDGQADRRSDGRTDKVNDGLTAIK